MTQEEKAKAYDEALERARIKRDEYRRLDPKSYVPQDIEYIFPELRESEDERMVRKIESFLSAYGADYFSNDEWREIEVWLEKKKESLHISESCKENPDSFTDDDERIRKWIIEELEITRDAMSGKNDYSDDPDIVARLKRLDEAIYWLEKQKENPKTAISISEDCASNARCPYKIHGDEDFIGDIKDTPAYHFGFDEGVRSEREKQKEPKQTDLPAGFYYIDLDGNKYYSKEFRYGDMKVKVGEQKPVEKQDYSGLNDLERAILRGFLCAGVENVPVGIIKDTAAECIGFLALIEPKPKQEWSEEDEMIRNAILGFLDPDKGGTKYSSNAELVEWSNWLKSLRPVKQELSEKDRKILDDVSHILAGLNYKQVAQDYKQAVENLLSLRPSWKPSEEQMNALQNAVALTACDKELARLYNQLKKL